MTIVMKLVCDFPGCGTVKDDLVWWESTDSQPKLWNCTRRPDDNDIPRHWCWLHSRGEINAVLLERFGNETGNIIGVP